MFLWGNPESPVALCEVQAYVFQAYPGAARMAHAMGKSEISNDYLSKAAHLRERFEAAFWFEELHSYAIALDRDKKPCKVRSSNATKPSGDVRIMIHK